MQVPDIQFEYLAYFGFGFLSSLHCLGMCGPIVLGYAAHLENNERSAPFYRAFMAHLLYNTGRIFTYSMLGAFIGAAGRVLDTALINIAGIKNTVTLAGGLFLILIGLGQLRILPAAYLLNENALFRFEKIRMVVRRLMHPDNVAGKFLLGVLLGFIPCMLTYAMFARAFTTQSSLSGFLTLFAFGLGTLPMLLFAGSASTYFTRRIRMVGNRLAGAGIVLMGVILLLRLYLSLKQGGTMN